MKLAHLNHYSKMSILLHEVFPVRLLSFFSALKLSDLLLSALLDISQVLLEIEAIDRMNLLVHIGCEAHTIGPVYVILVVVAEALRTFNAIHH